MKSLYALALFLLLAIHTVHAVQVVEVQGQPQAEEKKGWFDGALSFVKSPLFWGALVFIVLLALIIIGIILVIKWIVSFFKSQNDIFFKMKKELISLAKAHRRYPSKHWWKIQKNTPIHLVRMENGKPTITRPIGYHRGDYTTHKGTHIISLSMAGRYNFFILPAVEVLIIPDRENVIVDTLDVNGKRHTETIKGLPRAHDIIQYNENQILIYAESISSSGQFMVPVLRSPKNEILDLSLPAYQTLKDVAVGDYLFAQSSDFVTAARKAVDMNPSIRGAQKLTDTNQSVDVNTQENNL
jgi:hypothetical protein